MGFQTGDLVKASVPTGKYAGTYTGRIAIRFKPSFKLTTGGFGVAQSNGKSFDVHPKYLTTIHKSDGYEYASRETRMPDRAIYSLAAISRTLNRWRYSLRSMHPPWL
jgi:hypothetical protein